MGLGLICRGLDLAPGMHSQQLRRGELLTYASRSKRSTTRLFLIFSNCSFKTSQPETSIETATSDEATRRSILWVGLSLLIYFVYCEPMLQALNLESKMPLPKSVQHYDVYGCARNKCGVWWMKVPNGNATLLAIYQDLFLFLIFFLIGQIWIIYFRIISKISQEFVGAEKMNWTC